MLVKALLKGCKLMRLCSTLLHLLELLLTWPCSAFACWVCRSKRCLLTWQELAAAAVKT